jgi:release factor glutamine methyltransferase
MVIRPPVYIPRVETEQWVLLLAQHILSNAESRKVRILDICSGSGCIPLLLAKQGKGQIQTVGLEVDDRALFVARENAQINGIEEVSSFEKFDLFEGDLTALREKLGDFDMVVSNPPYVSSADMRKVEGSWWEGKYALQGKLKDHDGHSEIEDDGLSFYRRIGEIYKMFLSPNRSPKIPDLVLEVGSVQSAPVQAMFEGRIEVYKETPRRKDLSTPKLEEGDMVGTERSLWIYSEQN